MLVIFTASYRYIDMEIQFYHLLTTSLETALPKLMAKALDAEYRVLIKSENISQLQIIDEQLWSYDPASFLPHAIYEKSGYNQQQPILLATEINNYNGANLLLILDSTELNDSELCSFTRIIDIFNGNDSNATTLARKRWQSYKERNIALQYIKQQPDSSWKVEATANKK